MFKIETQLAIIRYRLSNEQFERPYSFFVSSSPSSFWISPHCPFPSSFISFSYLFFFFFLFFFISLRACLPPTSVILPPRFSFLSPSSFCDRAPRYKIQLINLLTYLLCTHITMRVCTDGQAHERVMCLAYDFRIRT